MGFLFSLRILEGDAMEQLRTLPSESVHCCVTSPPYWGLRDYGTATWEGGKEGCDHTGVRLSGPNDKSASNRGSSRDPIRHDCKCGAKRIDSQLGLERTPSEYVAKLVEVFREVRRVLRRDGTLWLNLGSSYAGGGNNRGNNSPLFEKQASNAGAIGQVGYFDVPPGFKPKDLVPIPWMVAMALQSDGWWLRSDIIWAKPNPMPESVTDRPTKAHEYLFLLTKSASYYFDQEAIREQAKPENNGWMSAPKCGENRVLGTQDQNVKQYDRICGANRRSVWTINTESYEEAHFATFPTKIPKLCIMAGTSAKGCCAKCGAPWERVVERGELRLHPDVWSAKSAVQFDAESNEYRETTGSTLKHTRDNKTLGWQPTCLHCLTCDEQRLSSHDATQKPRSREGMARSVEQKAVGRPEASGRDSGDSKQASDQMSALRKDQKDAQGIGILQPDVFGKMDVGERQGKQIRVGREREIQASLEEWESGQSAQMANGATSGSQTEQMGECSSHQRDSERQSNRESRSPDNIQSRIDAHEAATGHKLKPYPVVPATILDIFAGSGTTGMVALELGRKAVLIELNPHYVALIEQRCNVTLGLAL